MRYRNIVIPVLLLFIISCNKNHSDEGLNTLSGTWQLSGEIGKNTAGFITENTSAGKPIILSFRDNSLNGSFIGRIPSGKISGNYHLGSHNKLLIDNIEQPRESQSSAELQLVYAIHKARSYFVDDNKLKIYYDSGDKMMLFEKRDDYFRQMSWEQTKCADPWKTNELVSNENTADSLINYLQTLGIDIYDVTFEHDSSLVEDCESCLCKTGQKIIVKVEEGAMKDLMAYGFMAVEE